jgi:hypothetical protein
MCACSASVVTTKSSEESFQESALAAPPAGVSALVVLFASAQSWQEGSLRNDAVLLLADVDDAAVAEAAVATAGFSGRELAKMVASVQTAVYGGSEPILTLDLFRRVVGAKVMYTELHALLLWYARVMIALVAVL